MLIGRKSKRNLGRERGVVMLEAMIMPLVIFLGICVIDFTRLLTNYALLSRAVYEGVRYASGAPSLSAGEVRQTSATVNSNLAHKNIISRVQGLLNANYLNLLSSTRDISSQLCTRSDGAQTIDRVVTVKVEYDYTPIMLGKFPILFGYNQATIPIVVQDFGPYLLNPTTPLNPCF
jgi:Flp pilus assembly protein TadG